MLCHPFSSTAIQICRSQYAENETAKAISSIGIHFRQSFNQNCLLDVKAQYTPDKFEWQTNEFVWKNDKFDPCIRNSLSERDESSVTIDEFEGWIVKLDWQKNEYEWQFDKIEL